MGTYRGSKGELGFECKYYEIKLFLTLSEYNFAYENTRATHHQKFWTHC